MIRESSNPFDRDVFLRVQAKTAGKDEVRSALKTIIRMMTAVYGKPVILLIDEYDVPLAKAYANGFYPPVLDIIRWQMSTSLKTNDYLKYAVVTGCLRIPKETIFTGVNNFASYSVLDEDFSQYFGFTQGEVDAMLSAFVRSDKAGFIKDWYDGYLFSRIEIYCPRNVVIFVSALVKRENAQPQNYWENTSGNDAIRSFFDLNETDVSEKFETLLNGGTVTEKITNSLTYDQAYSSEENLRSILLMTAYITIVPGHKTPKFTERSGAAAGSASFLLFL